VARFGLVAPTPYDEIENPITRGRLQGLADGGLAPRYVYETAHSAPAEAAEATRMLKRLEPRPTAIVCQSDALAEGVLTGLKELGYRVPEDVSVTGYDGTLIPSLSPGRLTSVLQDGVLKGELLARMGIALREGKSPPVETLETFFLPGTTTAPAAVRTWART
jgi:DNA-binding LacI/PurR family transcriptional regulator